MQYETEGFLNAIQAQQQRRAQAPGAFGSRQLPGPRGDFLAVGLRDIGKKTML